MTSPELSAEKTKLPDYLTLPKYIGSVEPHMLMLIAEQSMGYLGSDHPSLRAHYSSVAASALIEAALVTPNPDHIYDDSLVDLVNKSYELLDVSREAERELLESGRKSPDSFIELAQAEIYRDFTNVYKDIVCGEVTAATCTEIIEALERRINSLSKPQMSKKATSNALGLMAELIALRNIWLDYLRDGIRIAIPSTLRGGDGKYNREQTHDIAYFKDNGNGFDVDGYGEVKSSRTWHRNRLKIAERYNSEVIAVNTRKGTVSYRLSPVVVKNKK